MTKLKALKMLLDLDKIEALSTYQLDKELGSYVTRVPGFDGAVDH